MLPILELGQRLGLREHLLHGLEPLFVLALFVAQQHKDPLLSLLLELLQKLALLFVELDVAAAEPRRILNVHHPLHSRVPLPLNHSVAVAMRRLHSVEVLRVDLHTHRERALKDLLRLPHFKRINRVSAIRCLLSILLILQLSR